MKSLLSDLLTDAAVSREACPDANLLCGYAAGTLTPQEASQAEHHLLECSRCRQSLAFASLPDLPCGPAVQVRLALVNAAGAVERLFEAALTLAGGVASPEPEPVYRGKDDLGAIELLQLGPYWLQLRRVAEGDERGVYLRLTQDSNGPVNDYQAHLELACGRRLSGRPDVSGWIRLDEDEFDGISTISIQAVA